LAELAERRQEEHFNKSAGLCSVRQPTPPAFAVQDKTFGKQENFVFFLKLLIITHRLE